MERTEIVKASFYAVNEERLTLVIKKLKESFGKDNIIFLSPKYFHKNRRYVLDMDIRIPKALLRFSREVGEDTSDRENREPKKC